MPLQGLKPWLSCLVMLCGAWTARAETLAAPDQELASLTEGVGRSLPEEPALLSQQELTLLNAGNGVLVDISEQRLYLLREGRPLASYPVSTSAHGIGSQAGSLGTPLGLHRIDRKIGAGLSYGTIFRGRVATAEHAQIESAPRKTGKDLVTSRILWLRGLEMGLNLGPGVDSWQRLIYIHGTPEEGLLGQPASDGCIRLANTDVMELFDLVTEDARVLIRE